MVCGTMDSKCDFVRVVDEHDLVFSYGGGGVCVCNVQTHRMSCSGYPYAVSAHTSAFRRRHFWHRDGDTNERRKFITNLFMWNHCDLRPSVTVSPHPHSEHTQITHDGVFVINTHDS